MNHICFLNPFHSNHVGLNRYQSLPWDRANWPHPTTADPVFRKDMAINDLGWEFDDDKDDDDADEELNPDPGYRYERRRSSFARIEVDLET